MTKMRVKASAAYLEYMAYHCDLVLYVCAGMSGSKQSGELRVKMDNSWQLMTDKERHRITRVKQGIHDEIKADTSVDEDKLNVKPRGNYKTVHSADGQEYVEDDE